MASGFLSGAVGTGLVFAIKSGRGDPCGRPPCGRPLGQGQALPLPMVAPYALTIILMLMGQPQGLPLPGGPAPSRAFDRLAELWYKDHTIAGISISLLMPSS